MRVKKLRANFHVLCTAGPYEILGSNPVKDEKRLVYKPLSYISRTKNREKKTSRGFYFGFYGNKNLLVSLHCAKLEFCSIMNNCLLINNTLVHF